jgi:hypothetical protein
MFPTVQALFEHVLDYAGMFPPARLPLPEALRQYAAAVSGPRQWLVGRFVCPAARLEELTAEAQAQQVDSGLQVAVLGQGGASSEEFLSRLADDLAGLQRFRSAWGWPEIADVVELPLPADLPAVSADALLERSSDMASAAQVRAFFEVPHGPGFRDRLEAACRALAGRSGTQGHGLKVRCGGLSADTFPSDETLAEFMLACRDARLPWKATAGLHHPLRHRDDNLGVLMHGFLNVFGAGVLSYAHPLTAAQLIDMLRDRPGDHFWFQNDRFGWQHWSCSLREVKELRRRWLPSFGSCSIDEPVADLTALGMIRG